MATIAVLGTFDSKGRELAYVVECIRNRGHRALLIDVGTGGVPECAVDISSAEVALAGEIDLAALRRRGDRGECVAAMTAAAPQFVRQLANDGPIEGIISLGGGGGTAIASAAMRVLPIGFPKLIVSTMTSGNISPYVGTKDIVMMPSVVDVAGINRISKVILGQAAGAICGMVEARIAVEDEKPIIVASMFGNTTGCVTAASESLAKEGYEVLVFHATGTGGRTMEALIEAGGVAGVFDVTTTELADELVGGVLSAGPDRCNAAAIAGVPAVVAPGCLDMVNFGEPGSVPKKFERRLFYAHNPQVTLMRTSVDESVQLGELLATKINAYTAPVTVAIPLRGVSVIGQPGGPFHDPEADAALFGALTAGLRPEVRVLELDCHINDPIFADACVEALLRNIEETHGARPAIGKEINTTEVEESAYACG